MKRSQEPSDLPAQLPFGMGYDARRLRVGCCCIALILGAIQTWATRHFVTYDGVSYLDMGDAFTRVGWSALVNACWSPLYPGLLGLASRLLKPSGYWDAPVAHLVNFGIYVAALASFDFFWRTLLSSRQKDSTTPTSNGFIGLAEWALLPLGYALFIWTTLELINLLSTSPDLCVEAFVYLAAGLIVRIRMRPTSWPAFLALGLVLGFGYWAKAPMFPMAFVFLGIGALAAGNIRVALPRVSAALLLFLVTASPLILALTHAKGRLTFGDSGRLNYAFRVDDYPGITWQGKPDGSGTPKHPTRQVLDEPAIYEYATPIKATYPGWYDFSYWDEGMRPHFSIRGQAKVLITSLREYYDIFVLMGGGLIVGAAILILFGGGGRWAAGGIAGQWYLWFPALAAMGMYSLVSVESRYVGMYFLLFWASILSGIRLPDSPDARRLAAAVALAMLLILGIEIASRTSLDISNGLADRGKLQCEIAEGLNRLGIQPGDKVASAGNTYACYWARLAKVSIIAEVPDSGTESFWWAADPQAKQKVFQAFARTGAKALVADRMPVPDWSADWQEVGNTSYYVHFLAPPGS